MREAAGRFTPARLAMLTGKQIRSDLEILHKDFQETTPESEIRTAAGDKIDGFLTYDETVADTGDGLDLVTDRVLVLRSATRYPVGTVITQGARSFTIAGVTGEEYAWQHRLAEQ